MNAELLTEKSIETLTEITEEKDLIDDDLIRELNKKKKDISTNPIQLGKIFLICHDTLTSNLQTFSHEKEAQTQLKQHLQTFDINPLRELLTTYGDGMNYGDHHIQKKISTQVNQQRQKYLELISLFFKIFGGEI